MIVALIILIALVIFLAFFVGKNLASVANTFWFFKTYTNISALVLVLVAFACGIIVAVLCMIICKLKASKSSGSEKSERTAREIEKIKKGRHSKEHGSDEKSENSDSVESKTESDPKRRSLARSAENAGKESINQ